MNAVADFRARDMAQLVWKRVKIVGARGAVALEGRVLLTAWACWGEMWAAWAELLYKLSYALVGSKKLPSTQDGGIGAHSAVVRGSSRER